MPDPLVSTYPATVSTDAGFAVATSFWTAQPGELGQAPMQRVLHEYTTPGGAKHLYMALLYSTGSAPFNTSYRLAVQKSTDAGLTWAEMDSGNRPTTNVDNSTFGSGWPSHAVDWDDANGKVWIVHSPQSLVITSFDFATDTWDTDTATGGPTTGPGGIWPQSQLHLVHRSDGSFVVIYSNIGGGNNFSRVYMKVWNGSWGSQVQPFANSGGTYGSQSGFVGTEAGLTEHSLGVMKGTSDRVHIFALNSWIDKTNTALNNIAWGYMLWHVSIDSSDTLDTPQVSDPGYIAAFRFGSSFAPGFYNRNSFTQPRVLPNGDVGFFYTRTNDIVSGSQVSMEIVLARFPSTADPTPVFEILFPDDNGNDALSELCYSAVQESDIDIGKYLDLCVVPSGDIWVMLAFGFSNTPGAMFLTRRDAVTELWDDPVQVYCTFYGFQTIFLEAVNNGLGLTFIVAPGGSAVEGYQVYLFYDLSESVSAVRKLPPRYIQGAFARN